MLMDCLPVLLILFTTLHTANALVSLSRREALRAAFVLATPSSSSAALMVSAAVTTAPLSVHAVAPKTQSSIMSDDDKNTLTSLRTLIAQARDQLDSSVPSLIQQEAWDRIRTLLATPPLSDLYKQPQLLQDYAEWVGKRSKNDNDELAVLQAREDLQTHLRFLDMAVYNNVFNPIKSLGETGATKQLVASYYDDPIREYRASRQALTDLYELGSCADGK